MGVACVNLQSFFDNVNMTKFEKICVRRLHMERDEEFYSKFVKFTNESIGKKYQLSVRKAFRKKRSKAGDEKECYFCSELVAKLYKTLGLILTEDASAQYWPGRFAQRNNLELNNAELGFEMRIDLD